MFHGASSSRVGRYATCRPALVNAGLEVVDSFVSITELSEYALGLGEEMKNMRLYPELPPPGKPAWCFYPMTKRRNENQNWYRLTFDERKELMYEHGTSGRKFAGRIVQLITASTGLDDWEWGVTLFGTNLDDLKDTVYTMRYDTASAIYAEFGSFYTGLVGPVARNSRTHSPAQFLGSQRLTRLSLVHPDPMQRRQYIEIDVSSWPVDQEEDLGTKPNRWLTKPDTDESWLMKDAMFSESRDGTTYRKGDDLAPRVA